ncbi:glycosyltransferase family 4 protein [Candidatus Thioglobus sp.]|nr:glycosyltransferase family 4 protein [Candidatus Thioglobus sp.]
MKIAILIRNYRRSSGGAERYCVELSEKLAIHHEVHVFAQSYEDNNSNIKFHKISKYFEKPRFLNQLLFSFLTRKIKKDKFEIVHSHELVSNADIYTIHVPCFRSMWLEISGFKKFLRLLNTFLSPRKILYLWLESRQMRPLPQRHFISVSDYLSRNIIKCYPSINNISIANPGSSSNISNGSVQSDNKLKNLRIKFSIPSNAFVMLLVANNFKKKGLPSIIESLKLLNNKKIYLIVAGNDNFKRQIISSSVINNIIFLGTVEDMGSLYRQVDLLIHPTLADTYGMAPLEAMSLKLPIIISNMKFCGLSEYLNDSQAVILKNPIDEIEIASKIDFLYKNIDERLKIAQNGFEKSKTISWEKTLEKTLIAYNEVAHK